MSQWDNILIGQEDSHTVVFQETFRVHRECIPDLQALEKEAGKAGFRLQVVSAFRSFHRQVEIWNAKTAGILPVLDEQGKSINIQRLSRPNLLRSILRWSALPGTSRHHWGTDLDIVDGIKITPGEKIQLIPSEFTGSGPFSSFHTWLDGKLSQHRFFRPYATERGGVSPERWHISYAPLAEKFLEKLSEDLVARAIENSNLDLKEEALTDLEFIFKTYVRNIDSP